MARTQQPVPESLARKRGFRAALLRRSPSLWPQRPKTQNWPIPSFGAAIRVGSVEALFSVKAQTAQVDFELSAISPDICQWVVVVKEKLVYGFDVSILGVRYRTQNNAEDSVSDKEETPNKQGRSESSTRRNPYAHLYGLLYPPTAEFMDEQIPQSADLYPYQKVGVEFLINQPNALLGDDMGLGKTAQCSVAIAVLRKTGRIGRVLIICPKALTRQWEDEAKKWGGFYADRVEGGQQARQVIWRQGHPRVLIATPQIVLNDADTIHKTKFDLVVCDDVTMLKNVGKITSAIRNIPRERSWCLSGTPLENKPEDWANVMEFVKPGLFSGAERQNAPPRAVMQKRVEAHFLRRLKTDKAIKKDLPDKKTNDPIKFELEGEQAKAYLLAEQQKWNSLTELGAKVDKIHIFAIISELIQLCNFHAPSRQSAKLDVMAEKLQEVLERYPSSKVVIFSRFVETLKFLSDSLKIHSPLLYHGSLSDSQRNSVLDDFKLKKDRRILLISTKAGARGLNLQHANYVFHFDRTWNPVDEMQAEDRCYRHGQKDTVFVYRFIAVNTIEERIHEILSKKQELFKRYVDDMATDSDARVANDWTIDDLVSLLKPKVESRKL